jgi:DNA-binding HxlR family transcriptional regulator
MTTDTPEIPDIVGAPEFPDGFDPFGCQAREVLDLVADKWSLYVVAVLGRGPKRFTELKRGITGISQRMLTVTLRGLERDGILSRTVFEVMPPHVAYELTPMGSTLLCATAPLVKWSSQNLAQITEARAAYDDRTRTPSERIPSETVLGATIR